jgi:hypothetical protein
MISVTRYQLLTTVHRIIDGFSAVRNTAAGKHVAEEIDHVGDPNLLQGQGYKVNYDARSALLTEK